MGVARKAYGKGGKGTNGQEPGDGSGEAHPRSTHGMAHATPVPAIMQHENERERIVVDGKRVDDSTRCSLVVIHEVGGTWALYPHGWGKFGVRLTRANAVNLARAILDSAQ